MITLQSGGVLWQNGAPVPAAAPAPADRRKTMAYQIFSRHSQREEAGQLHLKFDSLISHDITYVGIIQTAKASGLKQFPVPYVMTNCHNSLCAVGGTINEDDHVFGLSAAMKYGGNFVPANQAVIHQYAREMMAGCGKMILGSDSHTRYGAIGTMGVGEGGPEIVKQLLSNTYDIAAPQVGVSARIIYIDVDVLKDDFPELKDKRMVLINPVLTVDEQSPTVTREEGCLSLPGIHENVTRHTKVHLHWLDEDWNEHDEDIEGYLARVVQHEYDHLDGKLFIDHISPIRHSLIRGRLNNMIKGKTRVNYRVKFFKSQGRR